MRLVAEFKKPVEVRPRENYKIWLRYDDGASGEVDLSDMAGKGVFQAWEDREFFESVYLPAHRGVSWPGDLDLCADMLYMRLTGTSYGELFPPVNAA